MNIADNEYLTNKIEEFKDKGIILLNEHKHFFNIMIKNNSQENIQKYREKQKELRETEYYGIFYIDVRLMLRNNKTQNDIVNEFKIRLNEENEVLRKYKELYKEEELLMMDTPLSSKKIEVEQLEKFINEEIYPYL